MDAYDVVVDRAVDLMVTKLVGSGWTVQFSEFGGGVRALAFNADDVQHSIVSETVVDALIGLQEQVDGVA